MIVEATYATLGIWRKIFVAILALQALLFTLMIAGFLGSPLLSEKALNDISAMTQQDFLVLTWFFGGSLLADILSIRYIIERNVKGIYWMMFLKFITAIGMLHSLFLWACVRPSREESIQPKIGEQPCM